jgi:hypothetical protein
MPAEKGNLLDQFLTPEAMLTPGVAGSLTMMITNALAASFGTPRAGTGLFLSFVFGLLVLVSTKDMLSKAVFYVLNSLVIFCVAIGANSVGVAHSQDAKLLSVSPAFAQPTPTSSPNASASVLQGQYHKLSEDYATLSIAIETARKNGRPEGEISVLVKSRDEIDKKRQETLQGIIDKQILGGPNTEIRKTDPKSFFAPWKF